MNKVLVGVAVFSMVFILGLGAVNAFGFGKGMFVFEDREALIQAVESGDYDTWKSLKQSQLSEEKFNELSAKHQEREEFRNAIQEARESGDFEKLNELKAQFGEGKGFGKRNMNSAPCSCNR